MPATFTRPSVPNTAGNAAISTTTQVASSGIRYVRPLVEALDYRETPLVALIGFSRRSVNNRKVEWTDDRMPAISDTLGGSYAGGGATSLTVSNGSKFQNYNVVKIDSELFLVTAISTNTLTVTPAWAGTTNVAHANGATVSIIGVAMPENLDAPPASTALGEFFTNYVQRWNKRIVIDKRQNVAANYLTKTPQYGVELKKQMRQAKFELEQTLFHGVGVDATGALPSAMSGFPQYITTNVTAVTGAFSERQFLDALGPAFDDVGPVGLGNTVITGRFAKQVIGSWADPARRLTGTQTGYTARIDTINTDFGELDIMMHKSCPTTEIYFLNPKNYELCSYEGLDWHDADLAAFGDYLQGYVGGDFTLVATGNRGSAKMTGFSTTAGDYATMAA